MLPGRLNHTEPVPYWKLVMGSVQLVWSPLGGVGGVPCVGKVAAVVAWVDGVVGTVGSVGAVQMVAGQQWPGMVLPVVQ